MRIKTRLTHFALFFFALLLTATALPAQVRAQGSTYIFDSPWLSFDAGWFARGFEPAGGGPVAVKAADLDRDGDLDLVTGNQSVGTPGISVLMNAGDGNYNLPVFYNLPVDKSVADIALSDVDRDGDADVLATAPDYNGLSNILALWRNNGDGTFAPFELFATGPGPKGLALADFNGDGFEDVATANHGSVSRANNTFSVVLHNGQSGAAAGFLAQREFAVEGMDAQRVAAADLNGDGRPDLAVGGHSADFSGGRIAVLFNDGVGGFAPAVYYASYPGSRLPSPAVAFADLDRDGDADLIAAGMVTSGSSDRGLISIRRNNGNGVFGAPASYADGGMGVSPDDFAVGDLNKDTYPDVVAVTPTGRTMDGWFVILSDGAGGFRAPVHYEGSQTTTAAVIVDADRDGDADVIAAAASSLAVSVHRNNGDGSFPVLPRVRLGEVQNGLIGNGFTALEAGDIDKDGDADLVAADAKSWIIRNNGDGTFATAAVYEPPINPGQIKLRDLNGDGQLDLLFGPDRNAAPYHFGSSLNRGDGTFAPGTVTHVNACQAGSIDAADFDSDGDLDVVLTEEGACANGPGSRVFIFRNDGRGAFALATVIQTPCGAINLGVGDFNRDGRLDFVANNCNRIGVWPGKGDLTFGSPIDSSEGAQRFKVADLNSDGRLDLAMILTEFPASTAVIGTALGNSDGTFAAPRKQLGSSGGSDLVLSNDINTADFDSDGDLDVVVANNAPNDLSLFYNENGSGELRRHERYGVGDAPMFAAAADFDGDGFVDVASAIGLPPVGALRAVVVLRNRRFDLIGEPGVKVTSPANFSTYETPASVPVAADVRPVPGRNISKVEFYVSGENLQWKLVHTDTTFPYGGFNITGQAPGFYHVYAVAYDAEGTGISPAASYWVKNPLRKFTISGKVTDTNGVPLAGAEVSVGGPVLLSATTGADGTYSIGDLVEGETYSIGPYLDRYVFTPASQEVANISADQTINFVGRPAIFRISGRLVHDGRGLANATVRLSGTSEASVTTGPDGTYEFTGLPGGSNVKVTPNLQGYTFTPNAIGYPALMADETAGFTATRVALRVNHALASRGATATASTTLDAARAASAAINGERAGSGWGANPSTGSGWHDATSNSYPDWLEVNLGGVKSVDEVNVFSVQDNVSSPATPTEALTFTKYGVTDFTVEYWDAAAGAWVPVNGGMVNGNNKVWRKLTFPAVSTSKLRVVVTGALAGYTRLTEVEAWGTAPAPTLVNHALASSGATANASSTMDAGRAASAAINGDRRGLHWGTDPSTGSGWHDATQNRYGDWLEVSFPAARTVQQVNVFSVQDDVFAPKEPTEALTFTKYGVTNFRVEYWDGAAWLGVPGEEVFGNDKVWRAVTFAPVTTTKIRVVVNNALAGYSRLTEVEAWGSSGDSIPTPAPPPTYTNVASAASGATATASSTLDAGRTALAAINGDRRGVNWGANPSTGSGWHDATGNSYPDWLEVAFNGAKSISEVHVFSVQDNVTSPQEPTEALTFTKYGLRDFDVEYWDGAAWQVVNGGMVNGNDRVWRKLTFPAVTTTKIRVVAKNGLAGYSRLAEVEAY